MSDTQSKQTQVMNLLVLLAEDYMSAAQGGDDASQAHLIGVGTIYLILGRLVDNPLQPELVADLASTMGSIQIHMGINGSVAH